MLHELLLALVGCTGDVFMDVKEQTVALGLSTPSKPSRRAKEGSEESAEADGAEVVVGDECTFRVAPDLTFLQDSERWVFLVSGNAMRSIWIFPSLSKVSRP